MSHLDLCVLSYCLTFTQRLLRLYFCLNHVICSTHLVFLVSTQVSYAVLFKQLVVILLGKFFFPGTGEKASKKTPQIHLTLIFITRHVILGYSELQTSL